MSHLLTLAQPLAVAVALVDLQVIGEVIHTAQIQLMIGVAKWKTIRLRQYSLFFVTPETGVRARERAARWGHACTTVGTPWGTSAEPEAEAEEESEEEEYDSRLVPTQEELS